MYSKSLMPPRTLTRNVVVCSEFSVMVLMCFFHGSMGVL